MSIAIRAIYKHGVFEPLDKMEGLTDNQVIENNSISFTRYAGRPVAVHGLAGIPGVEPMAANPIWGAASCDPPVEISPRTALASRAIVALANRVSTCG